METLIYFDKEAYNNDKTSFEDNIPVIQSVIDAYLDMNIGSLNNDDFQKLFNEPESLIYDTITEGREISISGVKLDRAKAFEVIQKPVNYDAFISILSNAKTVLKTGAGFAWQKAIPLYQINAYYKLDNMQVMLHEDLVKKVENMHKRYATSVTAKKVFDFTNFVLDKCEELGLTGLIKNNPNGVRGFFSEILTGGDGKEVSINGKGILGFNNK